MTTCLLCDTSRPENARGLCTRCYQREHRAGRIQDWPRRMYTRADLLAEWAILRAQGYTRAQAAERLGVSRAAIDKALSRERRAVAS